MMTIDEAVLVMTKCDWSSTLRFSAEEMEALLVLGLAVARGEINKESVEYLIGSPIPSAPAERMH